MSRIVLLTTNVTVLAVAAALAVESPPPRQAAENDGKREFTLTGCLLRAGYAGYQMEGVTRRGHRRQGRAGELQDAGHRAKKWTLQGGGNLGPRVGEKVQVIGRSDWQERPTAAPDEPPKPPALEVKTVKTVAPSC